ncbi:MAG TPA: radical SAM protein, partial [Thermoplasmata archaeon]|nr:radical SAM protein [Thermoplasmata archaeon]
MSATKKLVKNFLKNRVGIKAPVFASFELTRRCNSKCSFCPIGNEDPNKRTKFEELSTEEAKRVFDEFASVGIFAASYLGGEPLLREDLYEIADHAHSLDILNQTVTNGILLEKKAYDLTRSFDVVAVSLDATNAEDYKEIRNVDAFEKVVDGIHAAVDLMEENKCEVLVNTVICKQNLEKVPEVIDYAVSLGVAGVMVDFATFHDYWKNIVGKDSKYDPEASDWRKKKEKTKELVKKLIKMKEEGVPIYTSRSYLKTFLTENFYYRCHPHIFVCVQRDGKVAIPCWDSKVTKFYDIVHQHKLKDLLKSKEVK